MRRPAPRTDDRGTSLLIVLIITTVVAVVTGVVLAQVDTSLRSTTALRDQAGAVYGADAAAQIAINDLRRGQGFSGTAFDNVLGTDCFGADGATLNLPGFYPATGGQDGSAASSASVLCAAEPGTGAQGSAVPLGAGNTPRDAVLTLSTNPKEDGLHVMPPPGGVIAVHGRVVSDSNIEVVKDVLHGDSTVWAHSGCDVRKADKGTINAVPPPADCTHDVEADPGYLSDAGGTVPPYRSVPTTCPGGIATFRPGYYDDAVALSRLMGGGKCGHGVFWFMPGTYYFDFHNNENPLLPKQPGPAADTWTIKSGSLVAGTALNAQGRPIADASGNALQDTNAKPSIPGACERPDAATDAQGVQFIFGGDSRFAITGKANVEICASYQAPGSNRPFIAIYGVTSGAESTTSLSGPDALTTTGGSASPAGTFTGLDAVASADRVSATWDKTDDTAQTATATFTGYAPATAIPAGSIVKAATLTVVHGDSAGYSQGDSLSLAYTPTGGGTSGAPVLVRPSMPDSPALTTDTFDLHGDGRSAFDRFVHANGLASGTMAYAATLTHPGQERIDAITLAITFVAPAFRSETTATVTKGPSGNCLQRPYTGKGPKCAVLSTAGKFTGNLYVEGTVYTPLAPIDVTLTNVVQPVFRFGVVSRVLWLKVAADGKPKPKPKGKGKGYVGYTGPLIDKPDDAVGLGYTGTVVDLTVYVCPGVSTSSCATDPSAQVRLTARVFLYDPTGVPVPGARQVSVLGWDTAG